ncbi:MAG TPA: hypothetical protein VKD70_12335 [Candidatus Acidoferrum sp.]|nr:hypothetical protein [Candidatus Acidoferrum sp.]
MKSAESFFKSKRSMCRTFPKALLLIEVENQRASLYAHRPTVVTG